MNLQLCNIYYNEILIMQGWEFMADLNGEWTPSGLEVAFSGCLRMSFTCNSMILVCVFIGGHCHHRQGPDAR